MNPSIASSTGGVLRERRIVVDEVAILQRPQLLKPAPVGIRMGQAFPAVRDEEHRIGPRHAEVGPQRLQISFRCTRQLRFRPRDLVG